MKALALFLVNLVLWTVYVAVQVPLWLLGFPVVAGLLCIGRSGLRYTLCSSRRETPTSGWQWTPRWAWLWGNTNDGVAGPRWWWEAHPKWSLDRLAFVWSAWRNPVNNLRLVPVLHPVIDPTRIRFVGNSDDPAYTTPGNFPKPGFTWAFTWQGIYGGLVLRAQWTAEKHSTLRLGWKLLPKDRFGVDPNDHRAVRCPFGVQLHLWRGKP